MRNFACVRIPQMLVVLATILCFSQHAVGASQVVWQIGKFDRSSVEFTRHNAPALKPGAAQAQNDLVYVVGKNKAETDWPNFQPGTANGKAGFRSHPYAIQFDLPSSPRGLYTLKVALLVESARVARLEVAINGHRALYFQHPVLDYSGGDVPAFSCRTTPLTPSRPSCPRVSCGRGQTNWC